MLPLLPTVTDFSDRAEIRTMRESIGLFANEFEPRDDVIREDRTVQGLDGDPDVPVRIYRPDFDEFRSSAVQCWRSTVEGSCSGRSR